MYQKREKEGLGTAVQSCCDSKSSLLYCGAVDQFTNWIARKQRRKREAGKDKRSTRVKMASYIESLRWNHPSYVLCFGRAPYQRPPRQIYTSIIGKRAWMSTSIYRRLAGGVRTRGWSRNSAPGRSHFQPMKSLPHYSFTISAPQGTLRLCYVYVYSYSESV